MYFRFCIVGLGVALLSAASSTRADTLQAYTSRAALAATDSVDWHTVAGTLGWDYTVLSNPFTAISRNGLPMTVSQTSGNPWVFTDTTGPGGGWQGDFGVGDPVLDTRNGGPLKIAFQRGMSAVGAQVEAGWTGYFGGKLQVYSTFGTLLGTYFYSGNDAGIPGTAPFIGVRDLDAAGIGSVVFTQTYSGYPYEPQEFAINTLSLDATPPPVSSAPLPGVPWAGGALLGGVAVLRARGRTRDLASRLI